MKPSEIQNLLSNHGIVVGRVYSIKPISCKSINGKDTPRENVRAIFTVIYPDYLEEVQLAIELYPENDRNLKDCGLITFSSKVDNVPDFSQVTNYQHYNLSTFVAFLKRLVPVVDKDFYREQIQLLQSRIDTYRQILDELD